MYRGTAHIILGSGLTIAGAVFCLTFTRLPYFQSLGIPAAIGVLVALVAALTLAPALLSIGRHFGLFEPARAMRTRGWRRIGTAIVRWPGPILVVDDRHGSHRSARPAGIQDQLRRPPLHACQRPGQRRLRGRRAPLLPGPAQSRIADDRGRPRPAQLHRHDPARAGRQGRLPHRRHRAGAVDHAAVGHAAGSHVDPVPDQRGQLGADQQPALSAGPRRRPAQAGRRDQRLHRRAAAAVCAATTVQRRHRRADQGVPADGRHGPGPARQDRQLRRLLPAAAQLLLLGATLFRHPGVRGVAVALRRAGRHRRADRPAERRLGEHRQAGCAAAETAGADPPSDRQPADQPRPDD